MMNRYSAVAVCVCGLATSAHAGFSQITFQLHAESGLGSSKFEVTLDWERVNQETGTYAWRWQGGPVDLMDDVTDNKIATLTMAECLLVEDPIASVNFAVFGGAMDTRITVLSGLVSFSPLVNPIASASANLNITDNDGNGASTTGEMAGGQSFGAFYNGFAPSGSLYTELLGDLSVDGATDPFGSTGASENFPGPGPATNTIFDSVSDISVMFDFTLSANDFATGSGIINVTPAPGSAALLGLGGLAVARRRR